MKLYLAITPPPVIKLIIPTAPPAMGLMMFFSGRNFKNKLLALCILIISISTFALGQNEISSDKVEIQGYTNSRVIKVEPDGLKIVHDTGVAKIPAEELSTELRTKYGFDEATIAKIRAKQAKDLEERVEEERINKELEKHKIRIRGRIFQVIGTNRVILDHVEVFKGRKEVQYWVHTGRQPIGVGRTSMNPKADYVPEIVAQYKWVDVWENYSDLVVLEIQDHTLGEGKFIDFETWPIGNFKYFNKLNQERTVELLTTSKSPITLNIINAGGISKRLEF